VTAAHRVSSIRIGLQTWSKSGWTWRKGWDRCSTGAARAGSAVPIEL